MMDWLCSSSSSGSGGEGGGSSRYGDGHCEAAE